MEKWFDTQYFDDVDLKSLENNINYWLKRQAEFEKSALENQMQFEKDMETIYKKSLAEIQKDIKIYYKEFADANKITIAEAKKWLQAKDQKEWQYKLDVLIAEMERRGVEKSIIDKYTKFNERMKINRLQALVVEIKAEIELLYTQINKDFTQKLTDQIISGYLQQGYILSTKIDKVVKMAGLDKATIEQMLKVKWVENGNFSSRIWGEKNKLQEKLQQVLTQGTILGESEREMAEKIVHAFKVQFHEAQRLIRTESTYYHGQGVLKGYKDLDIKEYEFLAMHPREIKMGGKYLLKGSKICTELDHKIFKLSEVVVGGNYPPI